MNQLTKLIEQYERETGYRAMNWEGGFSIQFVEWLASRPTCGEEQRKFLDEVEKGALSCYDELSNPKKYILRFGNGYRLYDGDFQGIDLSKVIKGG